MSRSEGWCTYLVSSLQMTLEKACSKFSLPQAGIEPGTSSRHVKINGSPVSLTENSAVFRKTDLKKKSRIFKNPLLVLPFFFVKSHFL